MQKYAAGLPHPDKKLQKQTQGYLEEAYENLLDKQLPDGGFAYWNNDKYSDPALTAYAIEFLQQAGEYVAIDDSVIKNAVAYLAKQQQKGTVSSLTPTAGLWVRRDRNYKPHPEDRKANAMLTASIAAMIGSAPDTAPLVKNALTATQPFVEEFDEPYTLANYALAAIAVKDKERSGPALTRLRSLALTENSGAYWSLETNTPFFRLGPLWPRGEYRRRVARTSRRRCRDE